MKKSLSTFIMCLTLLLPGSLVFASEEQPASDAIANAAGNPVDQFTGEYWMKTPEASKEAFLFGIDSAIAVEYFINSKLASRSAKAGKKPVYTLSPFEKGWMAAFKDVTRKQLISDVDEWYASHPKELHRPVLSVIWYQFIEPRLKSDKKTK